MAGSAVQEYEDWLKSLEEKVEIYNKRLKKIAIKAIDKEKKTNGMKEFSAVYEQYARDAFKKAVTEFYNSYDPKYYKSKRQGDTGSQSGGLYEVMVEEFPVDKTNNFFNLDREKDDDYMGVFDEERMHEDRKGHKSLFDKVFMQGWHGGAEKITEKSVIDDPHPNSGIPYYRKPGKMRFKDGRAVFYKYGKWGKKAVQTPSPYSIFLSTIESLEANEINDEFGKIMQKHSDIAVDKLYNDAIPALQKEIFL